MYHYIVSKFLGYETEKRLRVTETIFDEPLPFQRNNDVKKDFGDNVYETIRLVGSKPYFVKPQFIVGGALIGQVTVLSSRPIDPFVGNLAFVLFGSLASIVLGISLFRASRFGTYKSIGRREGRRPRRRRF